MTGKEAAPAAAEARPGTIVPSVTTGGKGARPSIQDLQAEAERVYGALTPAPAVSVARSCIPPADDGVAAQVLAAALYLSRHAPAALSEAEARALGGTIADWCGGRPVDWDRVAATLAAVEERLLGGDGVADDGDGRPSAEIVTERLSRVQAQAIDWLWSGWIPRGRLTVVAGHPGAGKSYLTQAVAAAVTVGATLPGDDTRRDPADVILISLEDDPADTLRPRLEGMGADLDRVHVYRQVIERRTDDDGREHVEERALTLPRDAGLLGDLIRRHDAAMVIIDPLVAVQDGAIDSHRQAAMRQVLGPLHLVAQETGAAIVVVAHLRKNASEVAIYRVGGSIDLVAAARTVIVVAPDPEDQAPNPSDRRRVACVAKSNVSAFPAPVAFTLRDGRFLWDSTPVVAGMTAEALLETPTAGTEERGALEEAMDFLREALADGPRPAKEVQREAREAGISEITLRRAKSKLGVRAVKVGMAGGWDWELPPRRCSLPPEDAQDDHTQKRDHLWGNMITFGDTPPPGDSDAPPEGDPEEVPEWTL